MGGTIPLGGGYRHGDTAPCISFRSRPLPDRLIRGHAVSSQAQRVHVDVVHEVSCARRHMCCERCSSRGLKFVPRTACTHHNSVSPTEGGFEQPVTTECLAPTTSTRLPSAAALAALCGLAAPECFAWSSSFHGASFNTYRAGVTTHTWDMWKLTRMGTSRVPFHKDRSTICKSLSVGSLMFKISRSR